MSIEQIIKDSVMTDSKVSNIRVNSIILVLVACGTFVAVNVSAIVQGFVQGIPITMKDIPVYMAGLVAAVVAAKAWQAGKEPNTNTEGK
jgi:hypothetical protein